ncbi:MAG: EthD family reductase [Dehalococcoidales bacterium]
MSKARIVNLVVTECDPAREAEFNKWYNEVHVPMLLKFKGIKKVTRYKMIEEKSQKPQYLAVYEYDTQKDLDSLPQSPEFKAAIAEMQGTWQGKGFEIMTTASYEPLKTWE